MNKLIGLGGTYLANRELVEDLRTRCEFPIEEIVLSGADSAADVRSVGLLESQSSVNVALWDSRERPSESITAQVVVDVRDQCVNTPRVVLLGHESLIWLANDVRRAFPGARIACMLHGTPTHSLSSLDADTRAAFMTELACADLLIPVATSLAEAAEAGSTAILLSNFPTLPSNTRENGTRDIEILQIGSLREAKRPTDVLEVLAALERQRSTAVLVGSGPLSLEVRDTTKRLRLEERVTTYDILSRESIAGLLSRSLVLFLASEREGMPRVVIEALMRGTVPIIADGANMAGLVTHDINGLIFPCGDLLAARRAVDRLLQDIGLQTQLRSGAAKSIESLRASRSDGVKALISWIAASTSADL